MDHILQECHVRREIAGGDAVSGGGAGPWASVGIESAAEVIERIRKRKRGSGATKKGGKEQREEGAPEHLMYDDLPLWEPDEAGREEG